MIRHQCLKPAVALGYRGLMRAFDAQPSHLDIAVTPSPRTRHAELLRLCARIGYSPPVLDL
ncbi:MAG TPA: hypothetical protein VNS34_00900 [Rhizobiaceae bacterium]|nr:hypothetical protein [Rhizobiaceae bacterium]